MDLLQLEGPKTTAAEATSMTVHHLMLAGMFFMNTPHDHGEALTAEIGRLARRLDPGDPLVAAMVDFCAQMLKGYPERHDG